MVVRVLQISRYICHSFDCLSVVKNIRPHNTTAQPLAVMRYCNTNIRVILLTPQFFRHFFRLLAKQISIKTASAAKLRLDAGGNECLSARRVRLGMTLYCHSEERALPRHGRKQTSTTKRRLTPFYNSTPYPSLGRGCCRSAPGGVWDRFTTIPGSRFARSRYVILRRPKADVRISLAMCHSVRVGLSFSTEIATPRCTRLAMTWCNTPNCHSEECASTTWESRHTTGRK